MLFHKYHALGNDYLVIEGGEALSPSIVQRICDRHVGLGSDGLLLEAVPGADAAFGLRIFNPDGTEAEKSGNGLRIFARYLFDHGRVTDAPFPVDTPGGRVECQIRDGGRRVFVRMGKANFDSARIPVAGPRRDVVGEVLEIDGERLRFTAVSVGNPHCVIHLSSVSRDLALRLGPKLEFHPLFPNRVNIQFVQVLDRSRIRIEIWERGAGYTLASGSSSCAAAAASVRLGLCDADLTVEMPGGELTIGVGPDDAVTLLGPVSRIASGELATDLLGGT